jgi:hypothetical protein
MFLRQLQPEHPPLLLQSVYPKATSRAVSFYTINYFKGWDHFNMNQFLTPRGIDKKNEIEKFLKENQHRVPS